MSQNAVTPIQRILFPTDFSAASHEAFAHAERMAAGSGATIIVLHVFPMPDFWGDCGKPQEADDATKSQLKEIQSSVPAIELQRLAYGGTPGEVVCWVAQELECDLIVMGTHGRTGIRHAVLGSVAEYVVRRAPCPVLTVRQQTEDRRINEPSAYLAMPPVA